MEIRQLQAFLMVAEEENISAAARRLNISQPALSRQIKGLEEELGWELLERGARSVGLTRAGRVVAWEGRKLMRQVELAHERMAREIEGEVLRVGYAPSLAHGFLGVAMERFVQRHPGFRVELADATRDEMLHALQDGSMNLAVEVVGKDAGVTWMPLVQHDWDLAVPEQHRFSKMEAVAPQDLENERLLLYSRAEYAGYWQKVVDYFREHGVNAKVAGEFDGRTSLMTALEAGMGVALVVSGKRMERQSGGLIVAKPLEPPVEPLCVGVGVPVGRVLAPSVAEFVEELKAASGEGSALGLDDRR